LAGSIGFLADRGKPSSDLIVVAVPQGRTGTLTLSDVQKTPILTSPQTNELRSKLGHQQLGEVRRSKGRATPRTPVLRLLWAA
jgi:hypothetical protein